MALPLTPKKRSRCKAQHTPAPHHHKILSSLFPPSPNSVSTYELPKPSYTARCSTSSGTKSTPPNHGSQNRLLLVVYCGNRCYRSGPTAKAWFTTSDRNLKKSHSVNRSGSLVNRPDFSDTRNRTGSDFVNPAPNSQLVRSSCGQQQTRRG